MAAPREGPPLSAQVVARRDRDARNRERAAEALGNTRALSAYLLDAAEATALIGYAEDAVLNLIANYLRRRAGWTYEVSAEEIRPVGAWQALPAPAWLTVFVRLVQSQAYQAPGEEYRRLDPDLAGALFARALAEAGLPAPPQPDASGSEPGTTTTGARSV